MLQDMAYGGSLGDSLFTNVSSSPVHAHILRSIAKATRLLRHLHTYRCSMDTRTGFHLSRIMPLQQR